MEHETFFALMMDALDGELADDGRFELESHLRACPDCAQEWQALMTVETLFQATPAIAPPAGFAQTVLAALPNRQLRMMTLGVMYLLLLFSGLIPLVVGGLTVTIFRPSLSQPGVWESIWQSVLHLMNVVGTVVGALFASVGNFISEYPAVLGWALVMAGVVSIWGGVLRQVQIQQPRQQLI